MGFGFRIPGKFGNIPGRKPGGGARLRDGGDCSRLRTRFRPLQIKDARLPHLVSLTLVLLGLWLALSGLFQPLLLGLGLASTLAVVAIAVRMDVVDHEGHPLHLHWVRLAAYWTWLLKEIIKANFDVARRILHPSLPISPTVIDLPATQRTDLGRVIYANSITLTPGTVTIDVNERGVRVHALTREAAAALGTGEMDRRVSALEERS